MSEDGHGDIIQCPVEGCDYDGTETQVSSHANAKADHPNWSEIKDQVPDTTPSKGSEGGPEGGDTDPSDEETGESKDGEASKAPSKGVEKGPEAGDTGPSIAETGESKDSETLSGGEAAPEGGGSEPQDSDTDMDEEQKQWSKAGGKSQEETNEGAVDEPGEEESGATGGDEGGGIPIPVSSTTLFLGVGMLVMGVLLYKWATLDSESGESSDIGVEQSEQTDESTPSEAGLIHE